MWSKTTRAYRTWVSVRSTWWQLKSSRRTEKRGAYAILYESVATRMRTRSSERKDTNSRVLCQQSFGLDNGRGRDLGHGSHWRASCCTGANLIAQVVRLAPRYAFVHGAHQTNCHIHPSDAGTETYSPAEGIRYPHGNIYFRLSYLSFSALSRVSDQRYLNILGYLLTI